MTIRIGILGASGFIGNRAVEMLHAEGTVDALQMYMPCNWR